MTPSPLASMRKVVVPKKENFFEDVPEEVTAAKKLLSKGTLKYPTTSKARIQCWKLTPNWKGT